ncbi:hypothetical protein AWM79_16060 [Pseudomonas agarici]|uniref:Uncharacterized protein n=1 Tax=Pseudomonas agarici TaxID=46677 RepID=A0A0X1T3S9_PSEAA|nr:hypothetical protein [Pseudomonas agarici]AMB86733.1 hypothetical protein AWM79_16060 [Pseudomonas agarici]
MIDENAGVYFDHLKDLPSANGRVWLLMSRVAPDEFPSIPTGWRKIDQHAGEIPKRFYMKPATLRVAGTHYRTLDIELPGRI